MQRRKLYVWGGIVLIMVTALLTGYYVVSQNPSLLTQIDPVVIINDQHEFKVRLADNPAKQSKGLAGTASLAENDGMYFPLDPNSSHSFWMKGMLIPIDIIWINDGRIVGIEHEVQPPRDPKYDNNLPIYSQPTSTVDGVLEIGSGRSHELRIEVGQSAAVVMSDVHMVDGQ